MKTYQTFIGVDIGKYDCVASTQSKSDKAFLFSNDKTGWRAFYTHYRNQLKVAFVVAETTGGYEQKFMDFLYSKKVDLHRANTRLVRKFIQSLGMLAKTDILDAYGLARYAQERYTELPLYVPTERKAQELLALSQRIMDVTRMLVQEKNRIQGPLSHLTKASHQRCIDQLTQEEALLRQKIKDLIASFPDKVKMIEILTTIPGIGEKISQDLVCLMPELGTLSRKQVASLAGVAPYARDSGTVTGRRCIQGGRTQVRRTLFMAAMTAARSKSPFGAFYQKLVDAGKPKMVALTALMRKIIVIANAKVRDALISIT